MANKMMNVGGSGYLNGEFIRAIRASGQDRMVVGVPWELISLHERQAMRNHSQTLERLSERGGLSRCEAVAILEDRPWHRMEEHAANSRLLQIIDGAKPATTADDFASLPRLFALGQRVRKKTGSGWQGTIVGFYSTKQTPIGYAIESEFHSNAVQIFPENALEQIDGE
jgi:hypothetical protein